VYNPFRIMDIVIYILGGLFALLALALTVAYFRTRHHGLLLMAAAYGTTASLALYKMHWWPLLAGFLLVWVFRLMGLDPDTERDPK
jgi:uncharacterized membrane protein